MNGMNLFSKLFSKKHKLVCVEDKLIKTGLTRLANDDQVAGGIGKFSDNASKAVEAQLGFNIGILRN